MDIKAVKNNIKEFGVMDTYKIHKIRNSKDEYQLKCLYIKELLPAMYRKHASEPLEDKVVFLQPRKKLNPSCRYFYKQLKKQGKYKLKLHELCMGKVSSLEYYSNALDFVRDIATAKVVVCHTFVEILGYLDIRPETKMVQLWHGCGIIKKLGMSTAGKEGMKSLEDHKEFPEFNKFDIVTIASEATRWIYEEMMGLAPGDPIIQPIGVSRTDEFFDPDYIDRCYKKLHSKIPGSENKKIILYAPTYRGEEPHRTAPDAIDIRKFAEALSDEYLLIIKQHQTVKELPEIPEDCRGKFTFDMTRGHGMNINELMTVSDICISDYSSVIYEFSLFERPIIFFDFDIDKYGDEKGMYYSREELAEAGPLFKTNDEIINYIQNIDERFDKEKVKRFKEKFMSACDGHATQRIMDYIES